MKKIKILYWVFTGLFAAFMALTAIPDIMNTQEAQAFMNTQLGYPKYITPFLGVAKLLGAIAILIPGFPRIKEWAYAGLIFDLTGASYSIFSIGDSKGGWVFMLIFIALGFTSYIFYHKKLKETSSITAK